MNRRHPVSLLKWVGLFLLMALIYRVVSHSRRFNSSGFCSNPRPAADYDEAVIRVKALQVEDTEVIHPLCRTRFMSHGRKTERVVVLVHGLTSSPQQFHDLGRQLYEMGHNVFIPRVPYHGSINRMTRDLASLTAEELVVYTDTVVDIAQGLGHHVTLAGISMGGVLTTWAAQHRADVDQAVIISPAFAFNAIPSALTRAVVGAALILPNLYLWWDRNLKDSWEPVHVYPRFPTHALGQVYRLGHHVRQAANAAGPQAGRVVMVTNAADPAVNNAAAAELVQHWQRNGIENISSYEFGAELALPHDLIDPGSATQKVKHVYPVLIDLMTGVIS